MLPFFMAYSLGCWLAWLSQYVRDTQARQYSLPRRSDVSAIGTWTPVPWPLDGHKITGTESGIALMLTPCGCEGGGGSTEVVASADGVRDRRANTLTLTA